MNAFREKKAKESKPINRMSDQQTPISTLRLIESIEYTELGVIRVIHDTIERIINRLENGEIKDNQINFLLKILNKTITEEEIKDLKNIVERKHWNTQELTLKQEKKLRQALEQSHDIKNKSSSWSGLLHWMLNLRN